MALLLDDVTTAEFALSLRKLRADYAGHCLQVHNGTSNANIGFDADGWLDEAALAAHLGSNAGEISTWYDESGNGRDFTGTAPNRPTIAGAGGVIHRCKNGRPAIRFSGDQWLTATYTSTLTAQAVVAFATLTETADSFARLFTQADASDDGADADSHIPIIRDTTTSSIASYDGSAFVAGRTVKAYDQEFIYTAFHSGSLITNRIDAGPPATLSDTLNKEFTRRRIGAALIASPGGEAWQGDINEVVSWPSDKLSSFVTIYKNVHDAWIRPEGGVSYTWDDLLSSYGYSVISKDTDITLRQMVHNISGYSLLEGPGERFGYNDNSAGGVRNITKKAYGYGGAATAIDASPLIYHEFRRHFATVMDFQDAHTHASTGSDYSRWDASPRDMGRWGVLLLNKGNWNGTQIIPSDFFASTFGAVGALFGHAVVPDTHLRTAGAHGSGNYLDSPSGAFTPTSLGGSDQTAIGPGMYGWYVWVNNENANTGVRPWPHNNADTIIADGHFGVEILYVNEGHQLVVAATGDWGDSLDLGSSSEWNLTLKRLHDAVTGTPSYAAEFPGASFTSASDGDAGLSTSELNSFVTDLGTSSGVIIRRGRLVRSWGSPTVVIGWASASKHVMVLTLAAAEETLPLTAPTGLSATPDGGSIDLAWTNTREDLPVRIYRRHKPR